MLSAYFAGKLVEIREPQIIEFSQKCIVKAYQKAVLNFLADPINKDIPSLDKLLLN